jgi:hypothetical protein
MAKAGLDPDQDHHQEEVVPERHLQHVQRLGAQEDRAERVDDPDLGVGRRRRSFQISEAPTKLIAMGMKISDFATLPQRQPVGQLRDQIEAEEGGRRRARTRTQRTLFSEGRRETPRPQT